MSEHKHGLKIRDEFGDVALEIGPHVIFGAPEFAAQLGFIAAAWAQAEVNLHCLIAVFLGTTPEAAAKQPKKYGSASAATNMARKVAAKILSGALLGEFNATLDQLDSLRDERNRLQHDVWGRKRSESHKLFLVHENEYFAFALRISEIAASQEISGIGNPIEMARVFAADVGRGYTIGELQRVGFEIEQVNKLLLGVMFAELLNRGASNAKHRRSPTP